MTFAAREAAIKQRELDVLDGAGAGEQIEALKDEAESVATQERTLHGVEIFDGNAVVVVMAGGGRIEAAEEVHEGGLAGAAGAHDGHEFTAPDGQIDATQGLERGVTVAVGFGEAVQLNQGGVVGFHGWAVEVRVMTGVSAARPGPETSTRRPSLRPVLTGTASG